MKDVVISQALVKQLKARYTVQKPAGEEIGIFLLKVHNFYAFL